MLPTLNFVSALAAVVFFFLPWTSIECRGERMATQTGLQVISGSAKVDDSTDPVRMEIEASGEVSLGRSYFAAAALLCAVSAVVMALAGATRGRRDLSGASGALCAIALTCLITQAAMGFPAKETLVRRISEGPSGEPAGSPLEVLGKEIAREVVDRIQVHPMFWFYLELAALGIPTVILLNRLLDRMRISSERRG